MKKETLSMWLLTTVPLLISIFLHMTVGDTKPVFAAVFLLNLFFVSYDFFTKGKSAGHSLYIYFAGLVLIPLYIYFRTIRNGHTYKFLIVWILLYLFDLVYLQMLAV